MATVLNRSTDLGDPPSTIEAGSSPVGIGGTLEQFPSVLFPSYPESGRSCGGVVGTETHRAVMPYGCVPLEAGQAGTTSEHNILSSFATAGDESGPQEPLYLNLYLPTHVDHDGAVVAAASVRVQALGGTLTEGEIRAALGLTGWDGVDLEEAVRVFCGFGNRSGFLSGESRCSPFAVGDSGRSLGIAQLNGATWAPYCGVTVEALMDFMENLRCARKVFQYDIDRGQPRWTQWSVKP